MKKIHFLLIPLFALALLVGCKPATSDTPNDSSSSSAMNTTSSGMVGFDGQILSGKHTVVLKTSMGDITLELDADAAPKTVTNFVMLAQTGFYDELTFHRVIPDFMIQGGDPNGNGTGGSSIFGEKFEDEINAASYQLDTRMLRDETGGQELPAELQNASIQEYLELQGYQFNPALNSLPMIRGAIAMANSGPNTNGRQFFIIQKKDGTEWLQGKHTVFGNVTDGMDVVDAITNAERGANDMPVEPITFTVEVQN